MFAESTFTVSIRPAPHSCIHATVWSDHWVSHGACVIVPAPMWGAFEGGVGTATDDSDGEIAIWSRGVWDRITATSCRWHQAFSRDEGKTWEHNWFMEWTRVA